MKHQRQPPCRNVDVFVPQRFHSDRHWAAPQEWPASEAADPPPARHSARGADGRAVVLGVNVPTVGAAVADWYHQYQITRPAYEAKYGLWVKLNIPAKFRVNGIHSTLLYNGDVLIMAGSGNNQAFFNAGTFKTLLLNPVTMHEQLIPTPWDLFCAGHIELPDGNILVAGGTARYENLDPDLRGRQHDGRQQRHRPSPGRCRRERSSPPRTARSSPPPSRSRSRGRPSGPAPAAASRPSWPRPAERLGGRGQEGQGLADQARTEQYQVQGLVGPQASHSAVRHRHADDPAAAELPGHQGRLHLRRQDLCGT